MSFLRNSSLLIPSLLIALGLAVGGFFISQTLFKAKVALNTAEVKGLAERRVKADRANWKIGYSVGGKTRSEIPSLYQKAEEIQARIIALLEEEGFSKEEIFAAPVDYSYREFRNENQLIVDQNHYLRGEIQVETEQVQAVSPARSRVNKLIAEGINITNRAPSYSFTGLNEIKPEMLREATKNARIAANEFASNAEVEVGGIRSARQGGFIIRDAGEEHGDSRKIEKDVRVVTTITFSLTE